MSDLIRRQDAIDEWKNDFKEYINALDIPKDDYKGIMEYIDDLPSAEPKTGRWSGVRYDAELGLFVCDNCGMFSFMEYAFCPNCGADMRGEKNETYRC